MTNPIEPMPVKSKGKANGARARNEELTGVFALLAKQHRETSALLALGKSTTDPRRRAEIWRKLRAELLSHERAETSVVYSVLHARRGGEELASDHDEEAERLETLVQMVSDADDSSEQWAQHFAELAEVVGWHAREEEERTFPDAMEVLDEGEAEELLKAFVLEKKRAIRGVRGR